MKSSASCASRSIERVDRFPDMKYSIEEVEEGPPGGADVAMRLTGDDLQQLGTRWRQHLSDQLMQVSTAQSIAAPTTGPRTRNWSSNPTRVSRPV